MPLVRTAANLAVTQDPAGNLKPEKDKATEQIDGIAALFMAIGRALVARAEPQPKYSVLRLGWQGNRSGGKKPLEPEDLTCSAG